MLRCSHGLLIPKLWHIGSISPIVAINTCNILLLSVGAIIVSHAQLIIIVDEMLI